MKLNTRPGNRPVFRRQRATAQAQPRQQVTIPAQPTELSELYTWAANAAVESDRPELAYELARSFAREA